MARTNDWNAKIIDEFRGNNGMVGGPFVGAPLALVHHRGRSSGREYIAPVMYLADDEDPATIYVFASKAGAPKHPEWFHNLVAAGRAEVEVGTQIYEVAVTEVVGPDRDRIFDEQASRYPGFAGYAEKAAGVRTIPVLSLRRV